jgi:hypothetical protein
MWLFKKYFTDRQFIFLFTGGVLLIVASVVIQFFVSGYVARSSSSPVTDIILSNTRVYDIGGIFVWGTVALFIFVLLIALRHINYSPFIMKSIALFTMIRSVFVSLTHISPFPIHAAIESTFFQKEVFYGIFTGNDLFFSGHTGVPFLLALIFWENKKLRIVFLGFSVLFATVVLLGHLHYSIDVLSAYFITYSIFHICQIIFKRDLKLFNKEEDAAL